MRSGEKLAVHLPHLPFDLPSTCLSCFDCHIPCTLFCLALVKRLLRPHFLSPYKKKLNELLKMSRLLSFCKRLLAGSPHPE